MTACTQRRHRPEFTPCPDPAVAFCPSTCPKCGLHGDYLCASHLDFWVHNNTHCWDCQVPLAKGPVLPL